MTWIRRNLFRSVWDGILSIVFGAIAVYVLWTLFEFVFITGRWEIIEVNLLLLLVGRFPEDQLWLVGTSIVALAFWISAASSGSPKSLDSQPSLSARILDSVQRFGLLSALGVLLILLAGGITPLYWGLAIIGGILAGLGLGKTRRSIAARAKNPEPAMACGHHRRTHYLYCPNFEPLHPRFVGRIPHQLLHCHYQHRVELPLRCAAGVGAPVNIADRASARHHLY